MEQDGNDSGAHRGEEPSTCQLITRVVGKRGETMGLGCAGGGGALARGVFRGTWERCNRDGGDRRAEFGDVKLAIGGHFEFPTKGLRDAIACSIVTPCITTLIVILVHRQPPHNSHNTCHSRRPHLSHPSSILPLSSIHLHCGHWHSPAA
jgi:hypothetical protein